MATVFHRVSPTVFSQRIHGAITLGGERYRRNLDVKSDYSSYDCWLSEDHTAGFAIHQTTKELANVFSLHKGHGREAVLFATHHYPFLILDCFDGWLVTFYGQFGFIETRREPNWTPGEADIVYMSFHVPLHDRYTP